MSSARSAVTVFLIVAACTLAGLAVVAITDERQLAFTPGVRPTQVAAVAAPGDPVCQRPLDVSADARSVRFQVGTAGRPGPELAVESRSARGRRAVAVVPAGYGDVTWQRATLDRELREGERIELCITNRGTRRVAIYGGPALAARTSSAYLDGRRIPTDLALVFERGDSRTALALVPTAFERAALFRPSWLDEWVYWVLAAAFLLTVPVLVAAALRGAAGPSGRDTGPPARP